MNALKTTLLLALLTVLLVLAGGAIGGKSGMTFALVMAAVMNFVSYWFSDRIVLAMYGAKQVTEAEQPGFYGLVRQLSIQAGIPMPKVYIIPSETPNAFATGRNPQNAAVAATTGIMRILTREELLGVMAHELSHVKHRDILISSIAATVAGAITYLANMAQWAAMFGGHRDRDEEGGGLFGMLVMAIVAPIAAMLIQMAISRSREYEADRGGAAVSGDPLHLASALRKLQMANQQIPMEASPATAHMFIVNPLTGGGILSLFSTHPPMEERIRRLEEMAYSRRF
ncbi:zinc metalloprotease HtpX [Geobacter sp. DSM 9736]|uniref:zinc metalloprotease HtpX n=1 Tax=Geobacter sp. DSM 9736 TaxID=1277350 RepID=UPI000B50DBDA|nr:zinc metalloprotease HtpX [Geobacter sp. DSM 9736]SNB47672.1 Heat shock protein. Metallo peptidase. MEROPS family M48B [Geobacter sp. DSM 9736]